MRTKQNSSKLSGYLFIMAAISFFIAAYLGEQPAFYGLGAAFMGIGILYLRKAEEKAESVE